MTLLNNLADTLCMRIHVTARQRGWQPLEHPWEATRRGLEGRLNDPNFIELDSRLKPERGQQWTT